MSDLNSTAVLIGSAAQLLLKQLGVNYNGLHDAVTISFLQA